LPEPLAPLLLRSQALPCGERLVLRALFYGTIVAASYLFGYLRIYTGSIWPATIAHAVHNSAWSVLATLTVTSSPALVNFYLVGDYGILILVGVAVGAIWVGYYFRSGTNKAQSGGEAPEVKSAPAATVAPR
jgi:hypothetical protein